jgi:hypothetical protein
MKALKCYVVGTIISLAPSGAAWAQHKDLEVTMDVVPIGANPSAATAEIKLPETASPQAKEAAGSGLETANQARKLKDDLGREFRKGASEAARERARDSNPKKPSKSGRP